MSYYVQAVDGELAPARTLLVAAFTRPGQEFLHPDACKDSRILTLMKEGAGGDDTGILHTWSHTRWVSASRPIYDLSADLCGVLARTRANVASEDIVVPFPTMYFHVEAWGQRIWNRETGEHALTGIYVSEVEEAGVRMLQMVVCGRPHAGAHVMDNALCSFAIPLPAGVRDCEPRFREMETRDFVKLALGPNVPRLRAWGRVVIGALVYLMSADADVEVRQALRPRVARRIAAIANASQRAAAIKRHGLGRVHYLGHRLSTSEDGRRLLSGHRVRAHYRWQRVGVGRHDLKLTLVRGHWRGPRDRASETARVYALGGEGDGEASDDVEAKTAIGPSPG